MQGKLHIAAAGDLQFVDDIQRRAPQHLILLIAQRLGRRDYDGVPGVHAHRIDIFHITDSDAVAHGIPHHFVFYLFPARDTALHQHLSHPGKAQAVLQNLFKLRLITGDAAARAAQRIRRTQYHRITDLRRKLHAVRYVFHHQRRRAGLPDLFHSLLEFETVLRLFDRLRRGP